MGRRPLPALHEKLKGDNGKRIAVNLATPDQKQKTSREIPDICAIELLIILLWYFNWAPILQFYKIPHAQGPLTYQNPQSKYLLLIKIHTVWLLLLINYDSPDFTGFEAGLIFPGPDLSTLQDAGSPKNMASC